MRLKVNAGSAHIIVHIPTPNTTTVAQAAELAASQAGWKVAGRLFEANDTAAGGKKYALPDSATCASVLRDSDRCLLEIAGESTWSREGGVHVCCLPRSFGP